MKTVSPGSRLTLPAPFRSAAWFIAEMPLLLLLLLRMLPASLMTSPSSLKRFGGAKSSAVKVPDFLSRCLYLVSIRSE